MGATGLGIGRGVGTLGQHRGEPESPLGGGQHLQRAVVEGDPIVRPRPGVGGVLHAAPALFGGAALSRAGRAPGAIRTVGATSPGSPVAPVSGTDAAASTWSWTRSGGSAPWSPRSPCRSRRRSGG